MHPLTPIGEVADQVAARPAPVLLIDTCSFLDLFRRDVVKRVPRVPAAEVDAVQALVNATPDPRSPHLAVPELVPIEFADHADQIQAECEAWVKDQQGNEDWFTEQAGLVRPAPPSIRTIGGFTLPTRLRALAQTILDSCAALARDAACLDSAFGRLIAKRRPSHQKEFKDSVNLEQCFALSRHLRLLRISTPVIWISSNTKDFADPVATNLHPDLAPEFAALSMEYFPTIRAALGSLKARSLIP